MLCIFSCVLDKMLEILDFHYVYCPRPRSGFMKMGFYFILLRQHVLCSTSVCYYMAHVCMLTLTSYRFL